MALFATTSYAKVENSAHDFNKSTTYGVNKASRCQYCHVPHNAQTWANTALWATAEGTTTYTYWSTGMTIGDLDTKRTRTCLACHGDGSVNVTGLKAAVSGTTLVSEGNGNLANDHPVGSNTRISTAGGMQPMPFLIGRSTISAGSTRTVECATCHSVHGPSDYTIIGRKLLYGSGAVSGGHPNSTDFCTISHDR